MQQFVTHRVLRQLTHIPPLKLVALQAQQDYGVKILVPL
nr:MAG TPA: hypothetical protein [Caudoviricetes sp.]